MKARSIIELSCYLDNQPGVLAKLTKAFAEKNISLMGIQVFEGQLQSLVMMVVDQPEKGEKALRSLGVDIIAQTEIVQLEIPSKVGSLAQVANQLGENGVNIKSIYSTDTHHPISMSYIHVNDVKTALDILAKIEVN